MYEDAESPTSTDMNACFPTSRKNGTQWDVTIWVSHKGRDLECTAWNVDEKVEHRSEAFRAIFLWEGRNANG